MFHRLQHSLRLQTGVTTSIELNATVNVRKIVYSKGLLPAAIRADNFLTGSRLNYRTNPSRLISLGFLLVNLSIRKT